jgi:hypothetical protein
MNNSSPKKRNRIRTKQKPGLTAKGLERKFVKHNYTDHSQETDTDGVYKDNSEAIFENFSVMKNDDDASRGGTNTTSTTAAKQKRSAPFPLKLHMMLNYALKHNLHKNIFGWLSHGRAFQIFDIQKFAELLIPKFFNQSKVTSFHRQLNIYGFLRLTKGKEEGAYYHEYFLRGKPYLTKFLKRNKVKGTKVRAASSPEDEPDFYAMEVVNPVDHIIRTRRLSDILPDSGGSGVEEEDDGDDGDDDETTTTASTKETSSHHPLKLKRSTNILGSGRLEEEEEEDDTLSTKKRHRNLVVRRTGGGYHKKNDINPGHTKTIEPGAANIVQHQIQRHGILDNNSGHHSHSNMLYLGRKASSVASSKKRKSISQASGAEDIYDTNTSSKKAHSEKDLSLALDSKFAQSINEPLASQQQQYSPAFLTDETGLKNNNDVSQQRTKRINTLLQDQLNKNDYHQDQETMSCDNFNNPYASITTDNNMVNGYFPNTQGGAAATAPPLSYNPFPYNKYQYVDYSTARHHSAGAPSITDTGTEIRSVSDHILDALTEEVCSNVGGGSKKDTDLDNELLETFQKWGNDSLEDIFDQHMNDDANDDTNQVGMPGGHILQMSPIHTKDDTDNNVDEFQEFINYLPEFKR